MDGFYEIREVDSEGKVYVRFPRYDPNDRDHPWDMRVTSFKTLRQALAWIYDDQYEDQDMHPEYAGLPVYWEHRVITFSF